jgi:acyl-CoA hydrolase
VGGEGSASLPHDASTKVSARAMRRTQVMLMAVRGPLRRTMPRMTHDGAPHAPKRVSESAVTLTQMMEVTDVNIAGTVHGGVIMRLVDTAAGLAAVRHAGGLAVTVAIDEMTFLEPVHIGEVVVLLATVNDVGTTSMECGVRVEAHDPVTGTMRHANSAYLVFVAVDDDGRPRPVPALVVETDDERRRQREARLRRQARLAHKEAVQAARDAESGATS